MAGRLALVVCTNLFGSIKLLQAQATAFVPVGAPVYGDIDLLTSAGLIDTIAAAARPYTRREIQRLLTEARRSVIGRGGNIEWANRLIDRNLARYAGPARAADYVYAGIAAMDSPDRPVPSDHNGSIDAPVNPLASWRGGRPIADGATTALETIHSVSAGRHLTLSLSPRVTAERHRSGESSANSALQTGSANLLFGNLVAEAGRDYVVFGPSPTGGLLLSANAPPLDMLRVSTERPARLPWVFGYLGPASAVLFVADLGADHQIHPHAKLVGYHMSIAPHRNLELGLEVLDETGGRGAPPASFPDRLLDAIPVFDAFRSGSDFQFSNKLAGVDARWRMPNWAGLELYVEGALDDLDIRRLRSSLLEDGGMIGGLSLACVLECGRLSARLEYHQTGIRYYTHADFASGVQAHGVMLGDPLGPRGIGAYGTLESDAGTMGKFALSGGYEVRSGNLYGSTGKGSHSVDFHFVQIEHRPAERRARLVTSWTSRMLGERADMVLSAGVERATNYAFAGGSRTNAIAQIGYQLWP